MLKRWAKECRFVLRDLDAWRDLVIGGGQEHDVIGMDRQEVVHKLTKRNEFGLFPMFDRQDGSIGLRPATPSEYFDRLLLQNVWFGDDIQLQGIGISDGGSTYVLTSQPFISGRAADRADIATQFSSLGFQEIDADLAAWIEPNSKIVLSDAHPRNVIVDQQGRLLPIDIIMGRYA